jgi:8-oxo-dGTP pyrophosphatase MutT (NUDIX family)
LLFEEIKMNEDYLKIISEKSLFKGRIIEVIENMMEYRTNGVVGTYPAEIARRSPGVRVLILNEKAEKILLNKELRPETQDWDYRLPGGKVFDTLDEYLIYKDDEKAIIKYVEKAAKKEVEEESNLILHNQKFLHKSLAGSTVIWDLYYYLTTEFTISKKKHQAKTDENTRPEWFTIEDAIKICIDGKIKEDRSAAVLLRYLLKI